MPLYAVTYDHPDEDGWRTHVLLHVAWLQDCLADGSLLASGPLGTAGVKSALLVMTASDRPTLDRLIATDPFAIEGLIGNITIREWDPIFGAFNERSSMPGQIQRRQVSLTAPASG